MLRIGKVFPWKSGEKVGFQIVERYPEKRRYYYSPYSLFPEIDNTRTEECGIEAQVNGQEKHNRNAGIEREVAIMYNNKYNPVYQACRIHQSGDKSCPECIRKIFILYGIQKRNKSHPSEKAHIGFGKGQENKQSGNQRE